MLFARSSHGARLQQARSTGPCPRDARRTCVRASRRAEAVARRPASCLRLACNRPGPLTVACRTGAVGSGPGWQPTGWLRGPLQLTVHVGGRAAL
eukprot:scaffold318_cov396-Prasinococcus_capsulatus_cf.AAC.7